MAVILVETGLQKNLCAVAGWRPATARAGPPCGKCRLWHQVARVAWSFHRVNESMIATRVASCHFALFFTAQAQPGSTRPAPLDCAGSPASSFRNGRHHGTHRHRCGSGEGPCCDEAGQGGAARGAQGGERAAAGLLRPSWGQVEAAERHQPHAVAIGSTDAGHGGGRGLEGSRQLAAGGRDGGRTAADSGIHLAA